jgi:hypothetical protein
MLANYKRGANMKNIQEPQQIQLELPDYSIQYAEWLNKKEETKTEETLVVIDMF